MHTYMTVAKKGGTHEYADVVLAAASFATLTPML